MNQTVCMYHGDCTDGTVSAAIFLKYRPHTVFFPLRSSSFEADMVPIVAVLREADEVYMLDYAKGIDRILAAYSGDVVVIDHHIGQHTDAAVLAAEDARVHYVYAEHECGATLTWQYFFAHEEAPELLKYVKDTDVAHLAYGDTSKYIQAYLSMYQNDPVRMLQKLDSTASELEEKGMLIAEFRNMQLRRDMGVEGHLAKIGTYNVPLYNVTQNKTLFGDLAATKHKRVVGMYRIRGRDVSVLFRSVDGCTPTALDVARVYGGGQHMHASSATIPLEDFSNILSFASVFEV
jgi:uncharacterized protein